MRLDIRFLEWSQVAEIAANLPTRKSEEPLLAVGLNAKMFE
jgi:hypothetical protein